MSSVLVVLVILPLIFDVGSERGLSVHAFRQWNYSITATDIYPAWVDTWKVANEEDVGGTPNAPRPRRGHTMVVFGKKIIMFGGRGNEAFATHIPKTYNVEKVNGTMYFTTYDQKPVSACYDVKNEYFTKEQQIEAGCTGNETKVMVGSYYNDVWEYDLECNRHFDGPCEGSGWKLMHLGALEGGCSIELGIEVCTVPSERYNHGAVMFPDGTMYIYGGYSQRCADFCDDIWMFDTYVKSWRQVYSPGELSKLKPFMTETDTWGGPGNRWRHTMIQHNDKMFIFGGHRIWHGFAPENSEDNNWDKYVTYPLGGYLDDFWVYTKKLDFDTVPGSDFKGSSGSWARIEVKEECYLDPGIGWEARYDQTCIKVWPSPRAGHATVLDPKRNLMWLFGGYTTYYPYLSTDGYGSGDGSNAKATGGFVPYPGYEYYLGDLWIYNFTNGIWTEVVIDPKMPKPSPRVDHLMLMTEDIIFLHGGFADNHFYNDVWYFDIPNMRWVIRKTFVYARYPEECTDDEEYIKNTPNCTEMSWPNKLERDINYPYNILDPSQQRHYYPDPEYGPYWNIFIKDRQSDENIAAYGPIDLIDDKSTIPKPYTPMFPFAASAPRQWTRPFLFPFNNTRVTLYERCTSVFAEPTRGRLNDGLMGRSNGTIFIAQPRRRRPGWDGCRHRDDRNPDLPNELQYFIPYGRGNHRGVYVEATKEILIYGGRSYLAEHPASTSITSDSRTTDDMWYYNFKHCLNNCSLHGDCFNGFCMCYVGYYGVDCSNTSCPGTFCYVNTSTYVQECTHACAAGYNHTDADVYVTDVYKRPCSLELKGEVNGVCDGFGQSQCAPPFIGDDCSIKDCKSNCSFNGWCSVEYPVSRCMCNPGYFGEVCENKYCLNNCSYPNGVCNSTSGLCQCRMTYSPYNNSRPYKPWGGEDCSYQFMYAAAHRNVMPSLDQGILMSIIAIGLALVANLQSRDPHTFVIDAS